MTNSRAGFRVRESVMQDAKWDATKALHMWQQMLSVQLTARVTKMKESIREVSGGMQD